LKEVRKRFGKVENNFFLSKVSLIKETNLTKDHEEICTKNSKLNKFLSVFCEKLRGLCG
jgi:hypothetical protein